MKNLVKGKVTGVDPNKDQQGKSFIIEGEDGNEYFAYYGDLKDNEDLVLKHPDRVSLEQNDEVGFTKFDNTRLRAIHVKKR